MFSFLRPATSIVATRGPPITSTTFLLMSTYRSGPAGTKVQAPDSPAPAMTTRKRGRPGGCGGETKEKDASGRGNDFGNHQDACGPNAAKRGSKEKASLDRNTLELAGSLPKLVVLDLDKTVKPHRSYAWTTRVPVVYFVYAWHIVLLHAYITDDIIPVRQWMTQAGSFGGESVNQPKRSVGLPPGDACAQVLASFGCCCAMLLPFYYMRLARP